MDRLVVVSFSPEVPGNMRADLRRRAVRALRDLAKQCADPQAPEFLAESADGFVTGTGWQPGVDWSGDESAELALLLCRGSYSVDGVPITGRALLAGGVDLDRVSPPFGSCVLQSGRGYRLLTDICGLKHIFVLRGAGWCAAATSALALAGLLPAPDLDYEATAGFALSGHYQGLWTPIQQVGKLPAGHRLVLERGRSTVTRYASTIQDRPGRGDADAISDGTRTLPALLGGAFAAHPHGVLLELSGGLDSRGLVAAATPQQRRSLRTVTLGTPESPDWQVADVVSQLIGSHQQFVDIAGLAQLEPAAAWQLTMTAAWRRDAATGAAGSAVLDWVEERLGQGPRFNGINGEYGRGRFYPGQRGGPVTPGRIERLARWRILANDAVDPWLFTPEALAAARRNIIAGLHEEFAGYPNDWLAATDEYFLYGRMQRWCGIELSYASTRRPVLAPYFARPYLEWARGLRPAQKRGSKVFCAVLAELDPEIAALALAGGGSPVQLAAPGLGVRVRTYADAGRRFSRKVGQRLHPGTGSKPVGAPIVARLVARHLREHPEVLSPLHARGWVSDASLAAIVEGRQVPSASSVGFLANLLVVAETVQSNRAADPGSPTGLTGGLQR
ncbi:MAG: asparagine synthase-related protein [Candidatus Nanopelagicales bacterium]